MLCGCGLPAIAEKCIVFDGAYPTAGVLSQVERLSEPDVAIDDLKAWNRITLFHTYSATKGKLLTFANVAKWKLRIRQRRYFIEGDNLSDKEKLEKT